VVGPTKIRRLASLGLALGLGVATVASAGDADTLRLAQNIPGDSKPVTLYADDIGTWIDGSRRVLVLKGQVLVEQGVVHLRMEQGVVWVNLEETRRTGIMHATVYGEGRVELENGAQNQKGAKALIELNTRGEFRLRSQRNRVVQQTRADDPLFRRAAAECFPAAAAAASPIQRTSALEPAGGALPVEPARRHPLTGPTPPPVPVPPPNVTPPASPGPAAPGTVPFLPPSFTKDDFRQS
jgi:hypothetical protein